MIDGSDNNDISVTISATQVPPEAVQEFQTISNPYSVEFGRNSGGQINIITKSGTNQFRGDFWDYYTSQEFNSLTNIEKAQGRSEPARFNRNQLGGDIVGPVFKDKTFFYALYQWDGIRPGAAPGTTTRVLTPAGLPRCRRCPGAVRGHRRRPGRHRRQPRHRTGLACPSRVAPAVLRGTGHEDRPRGLVDPPEAPT